MARSGLWVLLALLLGGALGVALRDAVGAGGGAESLILAAETAGGLWLDSLRMTVVPLLFALVVVGVAAASDAAATGRLAAAAVGLFLVMMTLSGAFGMAAAEGLLTLWPVDPAAAAAFVAAFAGEAPAIAAPGLAESLRGLVPTNPIAAAAEDAILPLVVFATVFGFAVARIAPEMKAALVGFFRATAEAMVVIVGWVLLLAPVGVFGLSVGVGARAGLGAAPLLFQYVAVIVLVILGLIALLYAIAAFGRSGLVRFAAAAAPVQALAASTQSSLACLPAMVERARDALKLPEPVIDLALPLGVALYRVTGPAANVAVAWFIVTVHGVEPSAGQIAAALLIAPLMSAGAVGLPGQVSFFTSMAPICLALGAPLPLLGVLLAVEVIPDVFRTIGNVTGHLGAADLLSRRFP